MSIGATELGNCQEPHDAPTRGLESEKEGLTKRPADEESDRRGGGGRTKLSDMPSPKGRPPRRPPTLLP